MMRYAIRVTHTCPEGGVEGRETWLAESEDEMEAMLAVVRGIAYMNTEVIGPVVEMPSWLRVKVDFNLKPGLAAEEGR